MDGLACGAELAAGASSGSAPGTSMKRSGYPNIPCSEMSRPASSCSSLTRRPTVYLIARNTMNEHAKVKPIVAATP